MRIWYVNKLLPKNQYPLALLIASQWYVSPSSLFLASSVLSSIYALRVVLCPPCPLAPLALRATSRLQFRVNLHKNTVRSSCCRCCCCWFSRKAAIVRAPYLSAICVLAISLGTCCISVMTERGRGAFILAIMNALHDVLAKRVIDSASSYAFLHVE